MSVTSLGSVSASRMAGWLRRISWSSFAWAVVMSPSLQCRRHASAAATPSTTWTPSPTAQSFENCLASGPQNHRTTSTGTTLAPSERDPPHELRTRADTIHRHLAVAVRPPAGATNLVSIAFAARGPNGDVIDVSLLHRTSSRNGQPKSRLTKASRVNDPPHSPSSPDASGSTRSCKSIHPAGQQRPGDQPRTMADPTRLGAPSPLPHPTRVG